MSRRYEGDFDWLPKWAQRHIETLEMRVEEWKEKAQEGPADSNTVLGPHVHGKPLGRNVSVRFYLSDDRATADWIDVRADGNEVDVMASDTLLVHPCSSNHVELGTGSL